MSRRPLTSIVLTSALAVATTADGARAQTVLHEFSGVTDRDRYGSALDGADLDGDGRTDLLIGAPWHDGALLDQGLVEARSGADGALLWRRLGAAAGDLLGALVAVVGDVDLDGTPDVLIGAPGVELAGGFSHEGRALIVSGVDGATLRVHDGPSFQEEFGGGGGAVGDIDGDGVGDYGVGALWVWDPVFPEPPLPAATVLFSGATGAALKTPAPNQGRSLRPAGDVDGDGSADWLLTRLALGWDAPQARLRSGLSPTALDSQGLVGAGQVVVGAAADVSGDGLPEYAFAWGPWEGPQTVELRGVGGPAGTLVRSAAEVAASGLVEAMDGRADLNGDGVPDLLVGLPRSGAGGLAAGEVAVLSGVDLSELVRLPGDVERAELGSRVLALGDLDGDGVADWATSAPSPNAFDPGRPGRVLVFSGGALGWVDLGQSLAGAAGPPALTGSGFLLPGTLASLSLSDAAASAPAVLVAGFSQLGAAFKGGVLGPAPDVVLAGLATDAAGALSLSASWPALPPATSVWFQHWIQDAGAPAGWAASNTVSATNAP